MHLYQIWVRFAFTGKKSVYKCQKVKNFVVIVVKFTKNTPILSNDIGTINFNRNNSSTAHHISLTPGHSYKDAH